MGRPQRMAAGSASDLTRGFRNQVRAVWSRIVATRGPAVRIWRIRVASRQRRDFLWRGVGAGVPTPFTGNPPYSIPPYSSGVDGASSAVGGRCPSRLVHLGP